MGFSFIFDTFSQHNFTAQQSVIFNTPGALNTAFSGFQSALNGIGNGSTNSSLIPGNFAVSIDPTYTGVGGLSGGAVVANWTVNGFAGSSVSEMDGVVVTMRMAAGGGSSLGIARGMNIDFASLNNKLVGNVTGIQINFSSSGGAAINQATGILIDTQNVSGSTNFAIRTLAGLISFGDLLLIYGGMNYKRTTFNNANATMIANDLAMVQIGAMSAPRTVTLPAANANGPGHVVIVADESGTVTGVNTLTVTRAGADLINGAATAVINVAFGKLTLMSDGASKWTIIA